MVVQSVHLFFCWVPLYIVRSFHMETVPLGFLFLSFPGIYLRIFFVFIFQFSFKHLNNQQSYFLLLKIPYIYTYIFLPWVTKVNKVKNQIYIHTTSSSSYKDTYCSPSGPLLTGASQCCLLLIKTAIISLVNAVSSTPLFAIFGSYVPYSL